MALGEARRARYSAAAMTDAALPTSERDEQAVVSLVAQVVDSILNGVLAGRYAPGQRLIAADLAEEYGVSRAPVREALHMLAGEGVVELIANRGARIRRRSVKELIDFLEFTEAILVLGVRAAAARMDEEPHRARVREALAALEASRERRDTRDFVWQLAHFHVVLNDIAGNEFLKFFYQRPYMRVYTLLLAEMAPCDDWDRFIDNYRMIADAILSGDAHSAVITFSSHIHWVLRTMRADPRVAAAH